MEHERLLSSKHDWIGALGISAATLASLNAAEFRDKWIPAEIWEALYLLVFIISAAWTVVLVFRAIRAHRLGGIPALVNRIKKKPRNVFEELEFFITPDDRLATRLRTTSHAPPIIDEHTGEHPHA